MTRGRFRSPDVDQRVVFDGQSLNNIPGEEEYLGNFVGPEWVSFPRQLMSGKGIPWVITAVDNTSWSRLEAGGLNGNGIYVEPASIRVDPQVGLATQVGLVMTGGTSDLITAAGGDGDSAVVAWANTTDYANNRRAAGFDFIIGLTVPGNQLFTPPEEIQRLAYNELMNANVGPVFDAVVDVNATPLEDWENMAYYLIDLIHWNTNGARVAADVVEPVLLELLAA